MSKSNEPAFPVTITPEYMDQTAGTTPDGLTKREYFAAHAPIKALIEMYFDRECATAEQCADVAKKYADALLTALSQEHKSVNQEMLEALDRAHLQIIHLLNEGDFRRKVELDLGYIVDAIAKAEGKGGEDE